MATIEIDIEDYLHEVSTKHLVDELARRDKSVPRRMGDGDIPASRYVEEAFLAAKAMGECPQAIKDLLWHVHGRAMP